MPAPGTTVTSSAQRTLRGLPTDTGVLFLAGPTSAGPTGTPVRLDSAEEYGPAGLGTRTGPSTVVFDAVEHFFAEGGATVYVSRTTTGTTPVTIGDALAALPKELGPGQVIAPGDITAHAALLSHAQASNRVALLDAPGFVKIGGIAASPAGRNVPPSVSAAGLIARSDATARSANEWPAGNRGYLRSALDVVDPAALADVTALATASSVLPGAEYGALFTAGRFTDAQRATLQEAGVNPFRVGPDGVQLYGVSGISAGPDWEFFPNSRLRMSQTARLNAAAEQFLFQPIDGEGRLFSALQTALSEVMDQDFKAGALFGRTAADAYDVDVSQGPGRVNTPATIAAGQLRARVSAKYSATAERVLIDLVKVAPDGPAL